MNFEKLFLLVKWTLQVSFLAFIHSFVYFIILRLLHDWAHRILHFIFITIIKVLLLTFISWYRILTSMFFLLGNKSNLTNKFLLPVVFRRLIINFQKLELQFLLTSDFQFILNSVINFYSRWWAPLHLRKFKTQFLMMIHWDLKPIHLRIVLIFKNKVKSDLLFQIAFLTDFSK